MIVNPIVRLEVRSGTGMWMGQGRDLSEALMSLSGIIPAADDLPPTDLDAAAEIEAARRAIAPGGISLRMQVRSLARWWNPLTWGTVEILMGSELK